MKRKIALYIRTNEKGKENVGIIKSLMYSYIIMNKMEGDISFFIDDGYKDNRFSEYKRMIYNIKNNNINTIVVKGNSKAIKDDKSFLNEVRNEIDTGKLFVFDIYQGLLIPFKFNISDLKKKIDGKVR